jgi:hypothetical protein
VQALSNIAAAHNSIILSQVFQRHYTNLHWCEEPQIKNDDLIFLSTKNLSMLSYKAHAKICRPVQSCPGPSGEFNLHIGTPRGSH